jgi:N-acetylmuramoyl-L-alanine amidase
LHHRQEATPFCDLRIRLYGLRLATLNCLIYNRNQLHEGKSAMRELRRVGIAGALLLSAAQPAWSEQKVAKPAPTCDRAAFRIALDVGHTPEVPGAISARGATEFEFNLNLARQIEQKLIESGFAKTALLVTTGPSRPGLLKRVTRANRMPADLFVSIHHDSVPEGFKELWEYLGKQQKFSDRFKGHSIFVSNDSPARKASLQFARLLGLELKARERTYTPHYTEGFMGRYRRELVDAEAGVYRFDKLVVLRSTLMPAVLLEAGSIVNRDEELLMGSPEHQALIGSAVTDAIDKFCVARSADKAPLVARRPAAPIAAGAAGSTFRPASATSHAAPKRQ